MHINKVVKYIFINNLSCFYSDIITFKNSKNETVDAVEVKSEDTTYLVKVGVKLDEALKNFISGGYEFDMDIHFNNY